MLELIDLHKHYGEVAALDGMSLTARPGRLLGFLGPNGSGKTTSMRSVFGLVGLDAGQVHWNGAPITPDDRLRFGYMPEQRGLYPRMTAGAQLTYFARLHGMDREVAAEASKAWLDALGLAERADDPVNDLSHGNQQRVQLAASLVHEPDLLVLDEPFNGLDPLGVAAMSEVLRDRAAAGATVVFSSHQLDLVEDLCDDVTIIASGRSVVSGSLEEVRAATTHRRVSVRMVGGQPPAVPEGIEQVGSRDGVVQWQVPVETDPVRLLATVRDSGPVERFSFEPPSLSEIFRESVGMSVAAAEARHAEQAREAHAPEEQA